MVLNLAFLVEAFPRYTHTIMPDGVCNISSEDGLKAANPIVENAHVIATFNNPSYGTHVLALGRDARLYHKHQTGTSIGALWAPWKCLTPDFTKVPCSTAPHCGGYDSNPVVQWQPVNGTAVVFLRQQDDLDIHETRLEDPTDPRTAGAPCASQRASATFLRASTARASPTRNAAASRRTATRRASTAR